MSGPIATRDGDGRIATDGLVVLDAHGVVFNRPFPGFVRLLAVERGLDPDRQWDLWRRELRAPFWSGRLSRRELWQRLAPGADPDEVESEFESRFGPGPLFDAARRTRTPLWLLTNHRSEWIHPRLERFGLGDTFERVLVSDAIGASKPAPASFVAVALEARRRPVVFVDDSDTNVAAARAMDIPAEHVDRLPAPVPASTIAPEVTGDVFERLLSISRRPDRSR